MSSVASPRRPLTSVGWLMVFLIPFVALAVHQWDWGPPTTAGDYAQYLLHAKAIVEGRPYADTGYIFHPDAWIIGPRAYPPGFPLTLAPLVALVGVHSHLFRLFMLANIVALAYLAARRLAMTVEPWQAAVGAGFGAFAIATKFGAVELISDPGFAALMWGTILAVDTTKEWTWRRILLVTVLGGMCVAYRLAGVAVIGAFALYALLTWRSHRGRAAIPLVIWGAGALAALTAFHSADLVTVLAGWRGVMINLMTTPRKYLPSIAVAMLRPKDVTAVNRVYYLCGGTAALVGVVTLVRRSYRSFLASVCLVYVLMLAVSPVSEGRYLWPLFPVIACALAVGLTEVVEWLRVYVPRLSARPIVVAILCVVAAAALYTDTSRPRPEAFRGAPNAEALFAWLRQTSQVTPMRVVFFNPRVVVLETGVPAMGILNRTPREHLVAFTEQRITHVICEAGEKSSGQQPVTNSLPGLFPDRFSLAYENPEFRVYRVLPDQTLH